VYCKQFNRLQAKLKAKNWTIEEVENEISSTTIGKAGKSTKSGKILPKSRNVVMSVIS